MRVPTATDDRWSMGPDLVRRLLARYATWLQSRPLAPYDPRTVERVCIFSMDVDNLRVGDRVAAAMVLNLVARRFPRATLSLVTTRRQAQDNADLYLRHSPIHRLIACDEPDTTRDWLALWRRLRTERFEVCVQDCRDGILNPLFAHLCGIRIRIGLQRGLPVDDFLTCGRNVRMRILGEATLLDLAESYARALEFEPALKRADIEPFFRLDPVPLAVAAPDGPIIAVHPGGGSEWNRRWPAVRYVELCESLSRAYNAHLIVIGGEEERPDADSIVREVLERHPESDIRNGCGGDLSCMARHIASAQLLVGNDSSAMHIAAGLGKPAVIIFGPTTHTVWDAYRRQSSVSAGLDCWRRRPTTGRDVTVSCGHACPVRYDPSSKRYPYCMAQVGVAAVLEECHRKLVAS